jgi:hypothetical protein
MGATLTRPEALTVPQARRRLAGTSCLSSDQVSELEKIVATFHAARPTGACVACGAMRWSEHTDGASESVWACSGCHRPATLTQDAWRAQQAARQATAAQPAAGPDPRRRPVRRHHAPPGGRRDRRCPGDRRDRRSGRSGRCARPPRRRGGRDAGGRAGGDRSRRGGADG